MWEQAHIDIGALAQRVTGLEGGVADIRVAISELSRKLDGKPTNWYGVIGGVVSMLALIGTVFAQAIAPINTDLTRHERDISRITETALSKEDYYRAHETLVKQVKDLSENALEQIKEQDAREDKWVSSIQDRLRADEDGSVSQRQISDLRANLDERYRITQEADKQWFERIMNRVDTIDAQLVKRPELQQAQESMTARINIIGNSLHEIQAQIEAAFPPSKVIEDIQRSLSELRARVGVTAAPGR
jgi:chromosome segregation ATPase